MCVFNDIFGSGPALAFELITLFTVIATAGAWIWIFVKGKLLPQLRDFALPVILWFVFGTLDIMITARGTIDDPSLESNPATRFLLEQFGPWGAPLASVLWISLWAGLVFGINRFWNAKAARFVSLSIFYSLATGHFFGFSSWFEPLCAFRKSVALNWLLPAALGDWRIIVIGAALGAAHCLLFQKKR